MHQSRGKRCPLSTPDQSPPIAQAFPPTRWSLVCSMRGERAEEALAELCRLYWLPLYAFARREGLNPENAEDVT